MSLKKVRSVDRVADALEGLGLGERILELPDGGGTAAQAASSLGCEVGQIVKSLVFRLPERDEPVLVLASGAGRVDEAALAEVVGEPVEKASPEFVRERTGFTVGGVSPIGAIAPVTTYIERGVLAFDRVWAAAGSAKVVFAATPAELVEATGGEVVDVAQA